MSQAAFDSLISTDQLSDVQITQLIERALVIADNPALFSSRCHGQIMALCFFESSTRTYFSFSSAMQRLGGSTIGFSDTATTSIAKGESLADTARSMAAYADIMVARHSELGSMEVMSNAIKIPFINGGEGVGEHPTQTLCDALAIIKKFGRLDVTIGLLGDLAYGRTAHSLIKTLSRFGANFYCIAPDPLQMPGEYIDLAEAQGVKVHCVNTLDAVASKLDVLYVTRLQKERLPKGFEGAVTDQYQVNQATLSRLKQDMIIMHPLPRVNEITVDVDSDPRAVYFQQAADGLYIRMALILQLLNKE